MTAQSQLGNNPRIKNDRDPRPDRVLTVIDNFHVVQGALCCLFGLWQGVRGRVRVRGDSVDVG